MRPRRVDGPPPPLGGCPYRFGDFVDYVHGESFVIETAIVLGVADPEDPLSSLTLALPRGATVAIVPAVPHRLEAAAAKGHGHRYQDQRAEVHHHPAGL